LGFIFMIFFDIMAGGKVMPGGGWHMVTEQQTVSEVLAFMLATMRGETEGRTAARLRAGELLGSYYGLWEGRGGLVDWDDEADPAA
jgi:hypothetical protein